MELSYSGVKTVCVPHSDSDLQCMGIDEQILRNRELPWQCILVLLMHPITC